MKLKHFKTLTKLQEQLLSTYNEQDKEDLKYVIEKVVKFCKEKNIDKNNFIVLGEYFNNLIFLRDNEENLVEFIKNNSEYKENGWMIEFLPKGGSDSKFFVERKGGESKEEAFNNLVEFLKNHFCIMKNRQNISFNYETKPTREGVFNEQKDYSVA